MRRLILAAVAVASLVSGARAAAPVPEVLGVQVGAPLSLPQCDLAKTFVPKENCWAPEPYDTPNDPEGISRTLFMSPTTEAGARFVTNAAILLNPEGVVWGVVILTSGVASQGDALRALESKFGKPDMLRQDHLQNRMGARFVGIRAVWHRFGLIVTFDSTAGDLDSGEIDVLTPAEAAARASKDKRPSL